MTLPEPTQLLGPRRATPRATLPGAPGPGARLGLLGALARGGLLQALRALGLFAHFALGLFALALLLLLRGSAELG